MAWRLYSAEHKVEMEDHVYSPLDTTKKEFRVLGLRPSSDPDSDIYCDLHQGEVSGKINAHGRMLGYQALSYVWGDSEPQRAIYIDQRRLMIGPNLYAALRRLRHERYGMLLWVDAVCIDQNNIEERNHQVKLMDLIYKSAKIVFMWLGEEADSSDLAMDILSLCENHFVQAEVGAAGLWSRAEHETLSRAFAEFFRAEMYDKHWNAVARLFVREYWSRLWILQEVLLASTATVCCGKKTVQWKYVNILLVIWSQSLSVFARPPAYQAFDVAGWARHLGELYLESKSRKLGLLEGLLISRQRWVTRKVDHVYGILGIVELHGRPIEPDYGKLTLAVFRETVQHAIQASKNLNILTACKRHDLNEPERVKDLQARIAANSVAREAFLAAESKLRSPNIIQADSRTEPPAKSPQNAESSISQVSSGPQEPPTTQSGLTSQEMQNNLVSKMEELTATLKDINISDRLERGSNPWPTWIPDWTRYLIEESYSDILYLLLSKPEATFYEASGSSEAKIVFPENPLLLIAHGGVFDRVKQISPYCVDDIESPTNERVYNLSKKDWDWYCSVSGSTAENPYGSAKARKTAYRSALILGRDVAGKEDDLSDHVFYNMFWENVESGKMAEDIYTNDVYTYYRNGNRDASDTMRVTVRIQRATWYMKYRSRFFVTAKGYIGRGPPEILPGDQVCLLLGGRVPFILREDVDATYRMVGESYVQGIMKGEGMEGVGLRDFTLH